VIRSIADQTETELGGPSSILARQRRDHVELDLLLRQLEDPGRNDGGRENVLRRLNRLVFSHAFAEEAVLWPVLRRALPDGEALTLRVEKEHQEVNDLVAALEHDGLAGPRGADRLARLVAVLREDVRDEEDVLLAQLQERLDDAELRRLGRRWEAARRISPRRPHPTVSRRPPGNAVSALPLAVLDRSRDVLDDAAGRVPEQLVPATRMLSRGLAAAAGLVERFPLAQRGERASTARDAT
jgi:hemerythrin superfamily protein